MVRDCWQRSLMRARRDSEEVSQAQAVLDETKRDYTVLGYSELEAMLQQPTENMELVLAFCEKAACYGDPMRQQKCVAYLNYYAAKLFSQADPNRLAAVLLAFRLPQARCRSSSICGWVRAWRDRLQQSCDSNLPAHLRPGSERAGYGDGALSNSADHAYRVQQPRSTPPPPFRRCCVCFPMARWRFRRARLSSTFFEIRALLLTFRRITV